MFKNWISAMKNTFNFKGVTTRKAYWQAALLHVVALYVFVVPYTLLMNLFIDAWEPIAISYLIIALVPMLSMYFRRANDAGWTFITALYLAVTVPVAIGLLVGAFPSSETKGRMPLRFWCLSLGFGLFVYGGFLSILLYDDVSALAALSSAGLLIMSGTLIVYGIIHWREVLAFLGGRVD